MKIRYLGWKPSKSTAQIIAWADQIIGDYSDAGYDLTLRQLYYQFVARDLLANTEKNYKRLGDIVSKGRIAGLLDWSAIVDRTRVLRQLPHWNSLNHVLDACARQFRYDTRAKQPEYIEVWVEKEALAGVVVPICKKYDVPCLVCRGYVSQSAMWQASDRFEDDDIDNERPATIIYLGDHDPSGIDMVRDIDDRLNILFGVSVDIERIALTTDQIGEYEPPPNPAKVTDTRYRDYVRIHGEDCWELDSLPPDVLSHILEDAILAHTDMAIAKAEEKRQEQARQKLYDLAN